MFSKELLQEEMPREKLIRYGKEYLTVVELLALLVKTGTKEKNVLQLSREILTTFTPQELLHITVEKISTIKGISTAKACEIVAVFELSKRIQEQIDYKTSFSNSQDIYEYVKHTMQYNTKEEIRVLYLNTKNKLIKDEIIAKGSIHFVHIDIKQIIRKVLDLHATSIILIHNHPSGDSTPSQADIALTTQLLQACSYFDISLLDHIIIGNDNFLSFYDSSTPPFT